MFHLKRNAFGGRNMGVSHCLFFLIQLPHSKKNIPRLRMGSPFSPYLLVFLDMNGGPPLPLLVYTFNYMETRYRNRCESLPMVWVFMS